MVSPADQAHGIVRHNDAPTTLLFISPLSLTRYQLLAGQTRLPVPRPNMRRIAEPWGFVEDRFALTSSKLRSPTKVGKNQSCFRKGLELEEESDEAVILSVRLGVGYPRNVRW
jgi:hypothetical protein